MDVYNLAVLHTLKIWLSGSRLPILTAIELHRWHGAQTKPLGSLLT